MSRRRTFKQRLLLDACKVDKIYQSVLVHIFVCRIIRHGKKSIAYRILYYVFDQIHTQTHVSALPIFEHAVRMSLPTVQLKRRRVGGTTYQVPIELRLRRGVSTAIKWITLTARNRVGRGIITRLAAEVLDSASGVGASVRKREEIQRIADANRDFVRYRF